MKAKKAGQAPLRGEEDLCTNSNQPSDKLCEQHEVLLTNVAICLSVIIQYATNSAIRRLGPDPCDSKDKRRSLLTAE